MSAWDEALAGAASITMVVQIANEFLAMMPRGLRARLPSGVLPHGIAGEDDIHYCHRALARAFPASAVSELDPEIGQVCVFFLHASARCMALSRTLPPGNSAAFGPRLQVSSNSPGTPRGRRNSARR